MRVKRSIDEKIQIVYEALYESTNIYDVCNKYGCGIDTLNKYINEYKDEVIQMRLDKVKVIKRRKLSEEDKDRIFSMYEEGKSYYEISEALGIKLSTVYNNILEYRHMKKSEETVTEKKPLTQMTAPRLRMQ